MSEGLETNGHDDTAMSQAFEQAGVKREEAPQKAAERLWKETKRDPIELMRQFAEWVETQPCPCCGTEVKSTRMTNVLGSRVPSDIRSFLIKPQWKGAGSFHQKLLKCNRLRKYGSLRNPESPCAIRMRRHRQRKQAGKKIFQGELDTQSGEVKIITKELDPFAHIIINGLRLAEVTTREALAYCDHKTKDVKFIRALCHLIPDPRKPIGEQWTPEIIRQARESAEVPNEQA